MSLVIAIRDKNRIVLGSDLQGSVGVTYKDHNTTKIWEVPDLPGAIMGSVGTIRASQIIQYSNVVDKNCLENINRINTDFIIGSLAPAIASALDANGIKVDNVEGATCTVIPNAFLFAYKDKAWMIWNDLSVSEIDDYLAIGSGAEVARGALFATSKLNPFERIVTSIAAASESTLFVDDGLDLLATEYYSQDSKQIAKALGLDMTEQKAKKKLTKKPVKKEVAKPKPLKEESKIKEPSKEVKKE